MFTVEKKRTPQMLRSTLHKTTVLGADSSARGGRWRHGPLR